MKLHTILQSYPARGAERLIPLIAYAVGSVAMLGAAAVGLLDCFTVHTVTNPWLILARIFIPGAVVSILGYFRSGLFWIPAFCVGYGAIVTGEAAVAVMKFGGRAFLSYCVPLGFAGIAGSIGMLMLAVPAISRSYHKG